MRRAHVIALVAVALVAEVAIGYLAPWSIRCTAVQPGLPSSCIERPWVRVLWLALPLAVLSVAVVALARRAPTVLVVAVALALLLRPAFVAGSALHDGAWNLEAAGIDGHWQCNARGYCLAPFDMLAIGLNAGAGAALLAFAWHGRRAFAALAFALIAALPIAYAAWFAGIVTAGRADFLPVLIGLLALAALLWARGSERRAMRS